MRMDLELESIRKTIMLAIALALTCVIQARRRQFIRSIDPKIPPLAFFLRQEGTPQQHRYWALAVDAVFGAANNTALAIY